MVGAEAGGAAGTTAGRAAQRPPDAHATVPETLLYFPRSQSRAGPPTGGASICPNSLATGGGRERGSGAERKGRGPSRTPTLGPLGGEGCVCVDSSSQATTGLTTAQARGSHRTKFYVRPFSPGTATSCCHNNSHSIISSRLSAGAG